MAHLGGLESVLQEASYTLEKSKANLEKARKALQESERNYIRFERCAYRFTQVSMVVAFLLSAWCLANVLASLVSMAGF